MCAAFRRPIRHRRKMSIARSNVLVVRETWNITTTAQQAVNSIVVDDPTKTTFIRPVSDDALRAAAAADPKSAATEIAVTRNRAAIPIEAHRRPRSTASSAFRKVLSDESAIR